MAKPKTFLAWNILSNPQIVDKSDAINLLEETTKVGDSESMWILGICCEYGIGMDQDIPRAEMLYQQSSDAENIVGLFLSKNGGCGRGIGIMRLENGL